MISRERGEDMMKCVEMREERRVRVDENHW